MNGKDLKIVTTNSKGEERFPDLLKVPEEALLKAANIEIGQLKSYIVELEEKLKTESRNTRMLTNENNSLKKIVRELSEQVKEEKKETRQEVLREKQYTKLTNKYAKIYEKYMRLLEKYNLLVGELAKYK